MAFITRTFTPADIFQGPADIYVNLTPPASSRNPTADANTLTLDASGQPSSATGTHLGLVEAPMMPSITEKFNEIHADQIESPIDTALVSVTAEVDFTLKETNLSNLKTMLNANNLSVYTVLAAQQVWQLGGQLDDSTAYVNICAIAPRRDNVGKYVYWMLYKAALVSAIPFNFQRSKESIYKLKFRGIADSTRVQGDELMQIVRQK